MLSSVPDAHDGSFFEGIVRLVRTILASLQSPNLLHVALQRSTFVWKATVEVNVKVVGVLFKEIVRGPREINIVGVSTFSSQSLAVTSEATLSLPSWSVIALVTTTGWVGSRVSAHCRAPLITS